MLIQYLPLEAQPKEHIWWALSPNLFCLPENIDILDERDSRRAGHNDGNHVDDKDLV